MSDMNTDTIYRTAGVFDLEMPPAVTAAQATHEAATALRDSIVTEVAPDLTSVTVKTLSKIHAAAVAWENRDARLRAAEAIIKVTNDQLNMAMFVSAHELRQPLAELFNQRGHDFATALEAMGGLAVLTTGNGDDYRRLASAANELDMLREARDAYSPRGSRAETLTDQFEMMSRVFRVTGKRYPDSLNFHNARGIDFWSTGITYGHVIAWQDRAAQEQNSRDCMSQRGQFARQGSR